jgi:purine-binding chemotaxis protein CheW
MNETTSDRKTEEILEARARRLAAAPPSQVKRRLMARVTVVGVGAESFGIPIEGVRTIVTAPPVAPLPDLPPWLPGVVQIRGQILGTVHLARWFGIPSDKEPAYLVVLDGLGVEMGLLINGVVGFKEIFDDDIASGLSDERSLQRPIFGTTRDLVSLIDLKRLASSPDLQRTLASKTLRATLHS